MKKLPPGRSIYATTALSGVPFRLGELSSESNPLPIALVGSSAGYAMGEPVSPANPLPVTLDPSGYKPGEPISLTNPMPIAAGFGAVRQAGTYPLALSEG